MMEAPRSRRASRARGTLAALLAGLHLALALGSAHHAGFHPDERLVWLPSEFHRHAYALTELPAEAEVEGLHPCVACQVGRLAWRLPVPVAVPPAGDAISRPTLLPEIPALPTDRTARAIRAPPFA